MSRDLECLVSVVGASCQNGKEEETQRLQRLALVTRGSLAGPRSAHVLPALWKGGPQQVFMDGWFFVSFPEGSRGMERTVVMDKSKGEPVISVKTTSRSKERVSIASAISGPTDLRVV